MLGDAKTRLRFGLPGSQLPSRHATRAVEAAEDAGFDSVWWADRLMGWLPEGPHELLDPFPLMAAAAAATSRIFLGTAVSDPVRRHPAQLAQTALTIQQLSANRLILGVGCGEVAGTRPYGILYDRPVGHLEEALQVMRLLWRDGKPVDYEGAYYRLEGAICGLAGLVPAPPVWIAAHGPRTLRLVGDQADGWMPTVAGAESYRKHLDEIRHSEMVSGRQSGSVEAGAFIWVIAADSTARARELLRQPALRALGLLLPQGTLASSPLRDGPWGDLVPTRGDVHGLARQIDPDELASVLPHGDPSDIAASIADYVAAGASHLVVCDMSAAAGEDNGLGMRPLGLYSAIREATLSQVGMAR